MQKDYKEVRVLSGQSLYDIALQEYGVVASIFVLFQDNTDVLPYLNYAPSAGTILKVRTTKPTLSEDNIQVAEYYENKDAVVTSGLNEAPVLPSYLDDYLSEISIPISEYIEDDYFEDDYIETI